MKNRRGRLPCVLLGAVFSAGIFFLWGKLQPERMNIPVKQVYQYVIPATATPAPLDSFRTQRQTQRAQQSAALCALAQEGNARAQDQLYTLVARMEKELAVESALAATGHADAVCAVRDGAVVICLREALDEKRAGSVLELCEKLTGECAENIFLLDECGYSW